MIINDTHFTDEQWRNIAQRKFYIVLQYYPEKLLDSLFLVDNLNLTLNIYEK